MKLGGIEIIFLHRRAERQNIIAGSYGFIAKFGIIAVNEINIVLFADSVQQPAFQVFEVVPAHMWYQIPGREFFNLCIKNTQAGSVSLFGIAAHKLLAQANTQGGLCK